jgi:hypothetical protein
VSREGDTGRPCNKGCHRLVKRAHKHECD